LHCHTWHLQERSSAVTEGFAYMMQLYLWRTALLLLGYKILSSLPSLYVALLQHACYNLMFSMLRCS
jgi:hypothetical protein